MAVICHHQQSQMLGVDVTSACGQSWTCEPVIYSQIDPAMCKARHWRWPCNRLTHRICCLVPADQDHNLQLIAHGGLSNAVGAQLSMAAPKGTSSPATAPRRQVKSLKVGASDKVLTCTILLARAPSAAIAGHQQLQQSEEASATGKCSSLPCT